MVVQTVGFVRRTDNLDVFRELKANREVTNRRRNILVKSIKENGYIMNPILVNENYEVIDGQGRLAACRELGIPIDYLIVEGLTIKECIILNQNAKNWDISDYVDSHATEGNPNYISLVELREYGYGDQENAIICSSFGAVNYSAVNLKEGTFSIDDVAFIEVKEFFEFLVPLRADITRTQGGRRAFLIAIALAYQCEGCSPLRLANSVKKYAAINGPMLGRTEDAVRSLEQIYNKGLRSNRLYLQQVFDSWRGGVIARATSTATAIRCRRA